MKKVLLSMLALVLAIALAIPMAAIVVAQPTSDTIYGITNTGSIHEVDPISGSGTEIDTVVDCPTGGSGPNGLAYDQDTNRIYYTEYPDQAYPGYAKDGYASLYFTDLDTGDETFAGLLEGEIACADIYEGHYYYIAGGTSLGFTDDLYEVELQTDGTIGTVTKYSDISAPANHTYGFWGDIAIQDGVIYGLGDCKVSGHDHEFFRVNCDSTAFEVIAGINYGIQLAFGLDGTLYGHDFLTGNFYTITWTDTSVTRTFLSNSSYRYTDLASGMTSTFQANPSLVLTKSTDFEGRATIGNTIYYTFEVYNDGDVDLMAAADDDWWDIVSDPLITDITYESGDNGDELLNPEETWYYSGTYGPLDEEDIEYCQLWNTATATAYFDYEEDPVTDTDSVSVDLAKIVTLTAGQHIDVGTLEIWNDSGTIHVTYRTIDGWYITETHLHVAENWEDIPQTQPNKKGKGGGNPIPGHFDYSDCWTPAVTEVTYDVELDPEWVPCDTDIAIAAHAVVIKVEGDCEDPFWATGYSNYTPGYEVDGDPIQYDDPNDMLGAPDAQLVDSTWTGFASLGFGGSVVITFDNPIFNGDCDYDISIHEVTGTTPEGRASYPEESADVYIWADGAWVKIATVTNHDAEDGISLVSIPEEYMYVERIKLVDTTDPANYPVPPYDIADGYDIDAVDACYMIVQEETAWGGMLDELDNVQPFPGANWATYIEYHVMSCPESPNGGG